LASAAKAAVPASSSAESARVRRMCEWVFMGSQEWE
jgi:hypothetical protein